MKKKSEIDELFYRLMGYYPNKAGEAYEIISAAALGIVRAQAAEHNRFLKGKSGGRPYQIDGLLNGDIMVEAKDYTVDDRKVGRPDLQKLQGALTDLPQIKEGYFTSATDYSRDAKKYARGTETNDKQKEITIVDVRPSTAEDEKGRIKIIEVHMTWAVPNYDRGKRTFIFAEGGRKMIDDYMIQQGKTQCALQAMDLYDKDGNFLISISELSRNHHPKFGNEDKIVSGEMPIDAYVKFYDIMIPIKGIAYSDVPIERGEETFTIEAQGNATIFIKSDKLEVNKLITDVELKKAIQNVVDRNGRKQSL